MVKKNTKRYNINRRMVNERLRSGKPASRNSRKIYESATDFKDEAEDIINNLSDSDKIALWHEYCDINNYPDNEIYYNDEEFWRMAFEGKSPYDLFCSIWGTNTNPNDKFITFNGYGNLVTFDWIDDDKSPFSIDEILYNIDDLDELISMFDNAGIDSSDLDAINSLEEE